MTVHLIFGYIAAGKTTFAKKLEAETGAVRFTGDEWMTHFYGDNPSPDEFSSLSDKINQFIDYFWPEFVRCKRDVILDLGFWKRAARDKVREKTERMGDRAVLYYVKCSDELGLKRALNRNKDLQGSLVIEENTYNVLKDHLEVLGEDEEFILIETDSAS